MAYENNLKDDNETNGAETIKSLAFLDLETTGLPDLEFNKTKITELSIIACSVDHFLDEESEIPRVQNKLTLCFNPFKRIGIVATEITGLSNELLEHENKFDKNAMNLICCFIQKLKQPVCLIAHNGDNFDFPLFKKYCETYDADFPHSLKGCDSLKVFRKINELEKQKIDLLKKPYSLGKWGPVEGPLIDIELFEETSDVTEPNDDVIDKEWQVLIEKELEIFNEHSFKKPDLDGKSMQQFNETTPVKRLTTNSEIPPFRSSLEAVSQTPEARKRPSTSKRELFPSTSTEITVKRAKQSFALREIYKRFFGDYPPNSHDAESDNDSLLKCAAACKSDFFKIVAEMCVDFKDIKKL